MYRYERTTEEQPVDAFQRITFGRTNNTFNSDARSFNKTSLSADYELNSGI